MYISSKDWKNYIERLSALDKKAGDLMKEWIVKHGFSDTNAMVEYAYALVQKYGEGSAALSAEMYDATAEMQSKLYAPAEAARPANYGEVARTVNGILKQSQNPNSIANGVSRLVKRTGADTTLNNALRDGAEFAWVPNGDTCAFCITLASRGWQRISKKSLKNGHAEHIHANCDCTYAVRFDGSSGVAGYDPQKYRKMYYEAEGTTPNARINSLRRQHYDENRDKINSQKRNEYQKRKIAKTIDRLEEESVRWLEKLSDEEKRSIEKYAYNPGDSSPNKLFQRINAVLRGEIPYDTMLKKHISNISSGISKFDVNNDFWVYRRVDYDPSIGLEVDGIFEGKQFFSTSVDPEKALKKEYTIKIHIKKGTKAAYIDLLSVFDQTELLIDANTFYKVQSMQEKILVLEVIP